MATTTIAPLGTASQQASAAAHFARRDEWSFYRFEGVRYVALPSARSGRVYRVRADGQGCDCPAYIQHGYAVCAHMLAIRLDAAERAAIEIEHQKALAAWIEEQASETAAATAAPTPARKRYEDIVPTCWTAGCDEDPEPGEGGGCWKHCNISAF